MAVIRDAVIRIRTEHKASKLEVPDVGPAERAFKAESVAAKQATTEIEGANKATAQHGAEVRGLEQEIKPPLAAAGQSYERFSIRSVQSLARAGHGLLQLTRGLALMATSSEQDTRKLLENLIKIEAGVSLLKGAVSTYRGLSVAIGSVATAAVGLAGAITGAFVALDYFSESSRRARRETKEFDEA